MKPKNPHSMCLLRVSHSFFIFYKISLCNRKAPFIEEVFCLCDKQTEIALKIR